MTILVIVSSRFNEGITVVFSTLLLLEAAPTLYLHWEYYEANQNVKFSIGSKMIQVIDSGEESFILAEEIDKVVLCMSGLVAAKKGYNVLCMSAYHHARIVRNNGKPDVVITNLTTSFVEKEIERLSGVRVIKKIQVFNALSQSSLDEA
jgi:hypothetical protein